MIPARGAGDAQDDDNWITTRGPQFMLRGQPVLLRGVNWFGFETDSLVPHGLRARRLEDLLDQVAALPANLLRLPFCNEVLRPGARPNLGAVDEALNPSLAGRGCLEVMDAVVAGCARRRIWVLLDRHRPTSKGQTELWHGDGVSEAEWIEDWRTLALRWGGCMSRARFGRGRNILCACVWHCRSRASGGA